MTETERERKRERDWDEGGGREERKGVREWEGVRVRYYSVWRK